MSETFSHQGGDTATSPSPGLSRWQKTVGVAGLIVVAWAGDRLYDVISSEGTGPGGGHQPSVQPSMQPTETDSPTAGDNDADGHDPSGSDHG